MAVTEMPFKYFAILRLVDRLVSILMVTQNKLRTRNGRSLAEQNGSVNMKMVMRFLTVALAGHN